MSQKSHICRRGTRGFSLVEVVLAVGIFAFVGVALIGLFSLGLKTNHESAESLVATHLAESLLETRQAAPDTDLSSNGFPLPVLTASTNVTTNTSPVYISESGLLTNETSARFGLLYSVTPDLDANVSRVYLCLYWPAQAAPTNALGRYETFLTVNLP